MRAMRQLRDRAREDGDTLRHPAFLATVAAVLAVGIVLAALLWMSHGLKIEEGHARANDLSRLLEEQTARSFQAVDLVLQSMADTARTFTVPEHDEAYQELLTRRLKALPHVRALFVIGANGFITHDTDHPSTPRVSLADREYFRFHRDNPADALHIGKPLRSRSVNRWFVSVSRRVDRPGGSFGGIVVAAVEPAFFDAFFGELHLQGNDTINLLHADGTLIARAPTGQAMVGQDFASLKLFSELLPQSRNGTYSAVSQADGVERIVSYRSVPGLPLVVTVALGRDAILADWTASALASAGGFAVVTVLGLAVAFGTIRRRAERRLAQERALATQKLEMLGQMTGGVAHDFNNVIAVASANLALAGKHLGDVDRLRQHLDGASKALERGAGLTGRLLGFARHRSLEVSAGDANELLRALEPMLRQAAGSDVSLALDLAPDLSACLVDRAQFDAALLNLVINARDAMPDGGSIDIATSSWTEPEGSDSLEPGSYIRILVRDSGTGMTPAQARRAFEPLFSTKGERGTGLGLSQVHGFLHRIGGDARIASRPGEGTTVELLFPCAPRTVS
jgi:signal transduction histidine kinase